MPNPPALVVRLITATARGQVSWTQEGRFAYSAQLGNTVLRLSPRDNDGVAPFSLLVTAPGKSDVVVTGDSNDERYNAAFRELYAAATTSSIDSAPAVSDALAELDRLESGDQSW